MNKISASAPVKNVMARVSLLPPAGAYDDNVGMSKAGAA